LKLFTNSEDTIYQIKHQLANRYYSLLGKSNNIDLLSMHIPRTAGTSFKNTLRENYGKKLCLVYGNKWPYPNRGYTVVHGHFHVQRMHEKFPQAKIITWVRHPVDRLVSLYLYWKKTDLNLNDIQLKIKSGKLSLIEFAKMDYIKKEMSSFFSGFDLNQFLFIGVVENYDNDINELSRMLSWKKSNTYHKNASSKEFISEKERNELGIILSEDIDLYNRVLIKRKLDNLLI